MTIPGCEKCRKAGSGAADCGTGSASHDPRGRARDDLEDVCVCNQTAAGDEIDGREPGRVFSAVTAVTTVTPGDEPPRLQRGDDRSRVGGTWRGTRGGNALLAVCKPYSWGLLFYMFAVAMLIVTGVWSARLTWITRLAVAHTLALTIVFWGLTLATVETLPRIGYAKAEATWFHP